MYIGGYSWPGATDDVVLAMDRCQDGDRAAHRPGHDCLAPVAGALQETSEAQPCRGVHT